MGADVNALLQNLKGAFSQLPRGGDQQPVAAPAVATPAAPRDYSAMLAQATGQSSDDAYQRMLSQALGGKSWESLFPKPAAPAAPAPAPTAPAAAVETPAQNPYGSDWSSRSGMDANVTAPGFKRGGLVPPTEAQKHAGNYQKHHVRFHGLPISIENPKGSVRSGKDPSGKEWRCAMPADYGYIKRTEGADGDHVDVFIGPDKASQMVFVINQNDHRTGQFDEHKAMLGYSSERAAVADYLKAFNDGKGADRIRSVEPMSLDAFKHWLKRGRTKTPAKSKSIVEHALALTRSK